MHRGIYAVGHTALSDDARELAAVLAYGPRAALSNRSAGYRWRMVERRPEHINVAVALRNARPRPGIRLHRTATLRRGDVRRLDGIPLTSPARTVLDLASELSSDELEGIVAASLRRGIVAKAQLRAQLARNPGRTGTPALRAVLDQAAGAAFTRSRAERRMLALVRSAGLPAPLVNARRHGYELDFLWPEQRLVVEVDGFAFHADRTAFDRDRRRDADLALHGYVVLRVTWRQLVGEPNLVVARIAAALAQAERA